MPADDRIGRRLVDRLDLIKRLVRRRRFGVELDAELVGNGRQHRLVPGLELAVEVFLGVALAARVERSAPRAASSSSIWRGIAW